MSDYSIPRELLLDDEADFLATHGVDLKESSVSFSRKLSRDDMRNVLALLISMGRRIGEPEENFVNFAIGDCANTAAEWFGENAADQIIKEVLAFFPRRDRLFCFAASALIYIQEVELLIKLCCSVLDVGLSVDDLLSNNDVSQRATMGRLRLNLEKEGLFVPEYATELKQFVQDRNCFVHSLWTVKLPQMLESDPDADAIVLCGRFIATLLRQAQKCHRIFKGLLASLHVPIPDGSSPVFAGSTLWIRYAQEFENVRRKA